MFSSPYPDITTPKLDIPSFVFATAAKDSVFGNNPNLVALTEATVILSYGGIKRLTEEFASGLANKLGLKKGDVIAMLLPNTPYYPVFVLGAHMIGITCAVANPAYTYAEIKHLLTLTEAKAILTTIDIVPTVLQALQNCKAAIPREFILTIDGAADNVTTTMCRDLYKRILITNFKEAQTTPAFIVLNSGTTGLPKGEIGYVDANGFYFILDQKKELIKFKGFSIAPAGLERILVAHPAVLDAAVIPVYQKKQGTEVPKAYVVLRPSAKNSPRITEEIKLWVAERVASYKALRGGIEIVDAIPKSVSGKILRRLLKDCQKQTPKL
ncbi:hypothetical protein GGI25_006444 [Coemansia spiralis]|uniref:Uncharacterized protein n=1 Tax=Coemansia spiralis TaxID=417178 RepID=A0A9W8FWW2_9FUNG|nr:hypothetical protein GGI25_006444 [Coemansia spiralis]